MRLVAATEYVNNVPTSIHIFPIAAEGDNDYRAIGSYNAFDRSQAKQCMKDCMVRRFWPQREHELKMTRRSEKAIAERTGYVPPVLPENYHRDIWDFYEAIGYDYKTKKFLTVSKERHLIDRYVIEYVNGVPTRTHHFQLDMFSRGYEHAASALNAAWTDQAVKASSDQNAFRFHIMFADDYRTFCKTRRVTSRICKEEYHELPVTEHNSVWAMFKAVGYEVKN